MCGGVKAVECPRRASSPCLLHMLSNCPGPPLSPCAPPEMGGRRDAPLRMGGPGGYGWRVRHRVRHLAGDDAQPREAAARRVERSAQRALEPARHRRLTGRGGPCPWLVALTKVVRQLGFVRARISDSRLLGAWGLEALPGGSGSRDTPAATCSWPTGWLCAARLLPRLHGQLCGARRRLYCRGWESTRDLTAAAEALMRLSRATRRCHGKPGRISEGPCFLIFCWLATVSVRAAVFPVLTAP